MKKTYSILVSLVLLCLILLTLFLMSDYKKVEIIKEESYFYDFSVDSKKVTFEYRITMKNKSNEPKEIQLIADMKKEVQLGMITKSELWATNKENGSKSFIVPPKTVATYEVEFAGDFTGNYQKPDRLLPEIKIVEIEMK